MAAWYVKNLGMKVVRSWDEPPYGRFLADATGRVVMEIYTNPADSIPDYSKQQPLRFHIAFAADDIDGLTERLVAAGAKLLSQETTPDGSRVVQLRDPWDVPLQLVRRAKPMG